MHRLFLALRPPEPIRNRLLDLMEAGDEWAAPPALRWQDEDQLHLTLRFIGPVERPLAEDLAAALTSVRFEPFALTLAGVGRFARRRGGALWAGIAPRTPLAQFAARLERLCQSAGLAPEHRAYHPHLTLARWFGPEPALGPWLQRHASLTSPPWQADRLTLYESTLTPAGAHYEAVLEVPAT